MNSSTFYGTRRPVQSRFLRHIASQAVPVDGNISDDIPSDSETETEVGDIADDVTDSSSSSSEAESADDDSDDISADVWSAKCKPNKSVRSFTQDEGPFLVLSSDAKPKDFFDVLFPSSIWQMLAVETNRYAREKGRLNDETTEAEIQAFLGVCMAMSIHKLPRIENYWSSNWVLGVPQFTQIFTLKRFWYLWSNLHLVDNSKCVPRDMPGHDRLFKVRPLMDKLNETFAENYSPSQNIAVDESMVRFKGRSVMKQYMPMKPIKRGFKIWCASCSCCGYLLKFQMYTGKESSQEHGLAHRVVTDLILPHLANRNHIIYMDNFFSSLPLYQELLQHGTMACGTYRTNRAGFPTELTDKTSLKKLARGDSIMRQKGDLTTMVWMDKKPVYVVTTAHQPNETTVRRRNPDGTATHIKCPEAVAEYNRNMGGVDLHDQLNCYYSYDRKSKRWWLRLFFHLLDIAVVNSFILYLHTYKVNWHPPLKFQPSNQLSFRTELIDQLVNHFTCRKSTGPVVTPVVSLLPSGHSITDLRQHGVCAGRCQFCSVGKYKKSGQRKETQFGCAKCKIRLCPVGCWAEFHKKFMPNN